MQELKIEKLFKVEGYTIISDYSTRLKRVSYICPQGHLHSISPKKFLEGRRCPICYYERIKGEGSPRFNPLLTDEERLAKRKTSELKTWRFKVLTRDNHKCIICDSKQNLNVHHLYSYRDNPTLRTEISNGVTLCFEHHKSFHKQFGYGDNTLEQFLVFSCEQKIDNTFHVRYDG